MYKLNPTKGACFTAVETKWETPTQVHAFHRFFEHVVAEDEMDEALCGIVQGAGFNLFTDFHSLPIDTVDLQHRGTTTTSEISQRLYNFKRWRGRESPLMKWFYELMILGFTFYGTFFSNICDVPWLQRPVLHPPRSACTCQAETRSSTGRSSCSWSCPWTSSQSLSQPFQPKQS